MRISRSYELLWFAFLVSNSGDWLVKIALPLIVYEKTGSAYHMASVYGVSFLPWIFFSIFGGVLADRFNRKYILILGHLLSLFFVLGLTGAFVPVHVNMWLVYILVFLLSSVEPLVHPSFQSILPSIVSQDKIISANSGLQLVDNTLNLIGPMIGGSLALIMKPENALYVDAASFLVAGILILFVNYHFQKPDYYQRNLFINIRDGFKYSYANKIVWSGSILFFFTNFGINMFVSNFMFFMTETLKYSAFNAGVTLGVSGGGAILGAFIAPLLNRHFQAGKIITLSTVCAGLTMLLLFDAKNYLYIGVVYAMVNCFGNINVITYFSLRQKVVPKEILGRVVSVTRMISYLSIPIGSFIGGYLVGHEISIYVIIIAAGFIRATAGLVGLISPLGKSKWSDEPIRVERVNS